MAAKPRTETRPPGETRRQLFSRLMREHHRDLLVFTRAATRDSEAARDIVQEALVTAWKKFEEFETDRDFGAWVRGIARNKAKDWFRRQQRQALSDSDLAEFEADLIAWRDSNSTETTIYERVEDCIGKLPGNFKAAVRAFYFEDRSGGDAADALSISPANLRKRLERARSLLHDCLSGAIPTNRNETPTEEIHA